MSSPKERIDRLLLDRRLVQSLERAKALIIAGKVFVDGHKTEKVGTLVNPGAHLALKEKGFPYVSRGGVKLEYPLDSFQLDVKNLIALDVGALRAVLPIVLFCGGHKRFMLLM